MLTVCMHLILMFLTFKRGFGAEFEWVFELFFAVPSMIDVTTSIVGKALERRKDTVEGGNRIEEERRIQGEKA